MATQRKPPRIAVPNVPVPSNDLLSGEYLNIMQGTITDVDNVHNAIVFSFHLSLSVRDQLQAPTIQARSKSHTKGT